MKTRFFLMLLAQAMLLGFAIGDRQWTAIGPLIGWANATWAWARYQARYGNLKP